MGNVPLPCCRSRSPRFNRSERGSRREQMNGADVQYISPSYLEYRHKFTDKQLARHGDVYESSHILQHISEREPDDAETDPSSNPFNRPIFATRSSTNRSTKSGHHSEAQNQPSRKHQVISPLISNLSQDVGYNSNATTSTNLSTHQDRIQSKTSFDDESITEEQRQLLKTQGDNRSSSRSYPNKTDDTIASSTCVNRFQVTRYFDRSGNHLPAHLLKASSCSTIYTDDSTISQPDLKMTIKCVSLAIYYHIRSRTSDSSAEIFDETIHPLKMPNDVENRSKSSQLTINELFSIIKSEPAGSSSTSSSASSSDEPDRKTIYNFVRTLFKAAQLTSEYAITTLVYLERLMTYAEIDLCPKSWRRMFLGAILLSSKVWEDQAVWNVDYAQILEDITVEDINELERQFLELIQFNMNVPSSVYAKYYFHLRTLAFKNGLIRQQRMLTVDKAKKLEALSRVDIDWHNSPIHRKPSSPKLKRYMSLEKSRLNGLSKAVLM